MSAHAFIFPGQGSQFVGMGHALREAFPAAREVFEEVDDGLSQKLSRLIFEGPAEELMLTENAQPALLAVSIATLRVLERDAGFRMREKAAAVAGHSLGEYSALVAADSLALAEAARLLRQRGEAMQRAVPPGEGAMAALLGVELEAAREICIAARPGPNGPEIVEPANDTGSGQDVNSGSRTAVERAINIAGQRGVKRAMMLAVSAPFHCALMQPAADVMAEALGKVAIAAPSVPVIANVSASRIVGPGEIRDLLVRQITGLVRWRESVIAIAEMGVASFVELGAGKVLTGLVRRIVPDAEARAVGTPAEIESLVKAL
ncbi:MAG: ACP S-malonyltransferase [Acetobacteraceae bacterium]